LFPRSLNLLLSENPRLGIEIMPNVFKIRLAVKSKGRGKSGGMRVVTHFIEIETSVDKDENDIDSTLFLIFIYDKSERANVTNNELSELIRDLTTELEEE
jgi:hypothetical protein